MKSVSLQSRKEKKKNVVDSLFCGFHIDSPLSGRQERPSVQVPRNSLLSLSLSLSELHSFFFNITVTLHFVPVSPRLIDAALGHSWHLDIVAYLVGSCFQFLEALVFLTCFANPLALLQWHSAWLTRRRLETMLSLP